MRPILALAASLAVLATSSAAHAQTAAEKKFVVDAIQGDLGEIELGRLAAEKGGSDAVKQFGQTLQTDHGAALAQMQDLARSQNIAPPTEPKAEALKERDRLAKLDGQAFDRDFVRFMVQDHEKDIRDFERESKGGSAVATLARAQLPVLQKHLQTAKSLQGRH